MKFLVSTTNVLSYLSNSVLLLKKSSTNVSNFDKFYYSLADSGYEDIHKAAVELNALVVAADILVHCCFGAVLGHLNAVQEKYKDLLQGIYIYYLKYEMLCNIYSWPFVTIRCLVEIVPLC